RGANVVDHTVHGRRLPAHRAGDGATRPAAGDGPGAVAAALGSAAHRHSAHGGDEQVLLVKWGATRARAIIREEVVIQTESNTYQVKWRGNNPGGCSRTDKLPARHSFDELCISFSSHTPV
ncbi:unnamed protein product, partial [Leptidea sinapis]